MGGRGHADRGGPAFLDAARMLDASARGPVAPTAPRGPRGGQTGGEAGPGEPRFPPAPPVFSRADSPVLVPTTALENGLI